MIIIVCMALHNFILDSRIADREFAMCDADANYLPMPTPTQFECPEDEPLVEDSNMNGFVMSWHMLCFMACNVSFVSVH